MLNINDAPPPRTCGILTQNKSLTNKCRFTCYAILLAIHFLLGCLFLFDRSPGTDAALTAFPLDDSWIHMVYGRALAHHGLPYYNDGVLEAGFTSPLWISALAVCEWFTLLTGVSAALVVKIVGILIAATVSIAAFELLLALCGSWLIALIGGILVAASPTIAFSQVSGMEVCLASSLALWGILALAREQYLKSGILAGLAFLARPEMFLLLPVLLLTEVLGNRESKMKNRSATITKLVVPTLIFGAVWSLYCYSVTGHILPNTFYSKYTSSAFISGLWLIVKEIVLATPSMFLLSGVLLYLVGTVHLIRSKHPVKLTIVLFPWVFLAGLAATRALWEGNGQYFYWLRYAIPVLPLFIFPIVFGFKLFWVGQFFAVRKLEGSAPKVSRVLGVLLLLVGLSKYPLDISEQMTQFAWNCQNMNEVQVEFGKWVSRVASRDAVVMVNDAGAIRYFGNRKTIDLMGLNNNQILFDKSFQQKTYTDADSMLSFMKESKSDYLIIFPTWFPQLIRSVNFREDFSVLVHFESKHYTVSAARQDIMVAFGLLK